MKEDTINLAGYLDPDMRQSMVVLMEGELDMVIDMIETINSSGPRYMELLEEGVNQANRLDIAEAAFALKSNYCQVGAILFSNLCEAMVAASQQMYPQAIHRIHQQLQEEYILVLQSLDAWKDTLLLEDY
ncbi:MAG: hypothetical protein AAFW00_07950 [Bacteroidota bacterium]